MKCIAVLFLVILTTNTGTLAQSALRGPVRAVAWSKTPEDCRCIAPMIWVKHDTDPKEAARQSQTKPPGMAAIFLWDMALPLLHHPDDVCKTPVGEPTKLQGVWPDHGVETLRRTAIDFFTAYKAAGGRLDFLVLDFEDGLSNWQLSPDTVHAIQNDPRSANLKRRLGFDDFSNVIDFGKGPEYLTWNAVTGQIVCDALNRAIFYPVHKLYPQVKASNYGSFLMSPANVVPELNGHKQFSIGYCGNVQSPAFYGEIGQLAGRPLAGEHPYGKAPFDVLRWELNTMRAIRRSGGAPISPWICHKNYTNGAYRTNDYYQELIYHLALSGAQDFLFWNPAKWIPTQKEEEFRTDAHDRIVNACLKTLNAKFGEASRTCITRAPLPWDSPLIVTGMRIGRRILWRITAPPGVAYVRVQPTNQRRSLHDTPGVWYTSDTPDVRFLPE